MFCHGWQNKAASSHGWLVVAAHVRLNPTPSDIFSSSYPRTTKLPLPAAPTGLPSQPSDHTFSPSLAFLQWQHDLRHKHPRLILPVNVPAIFFNHKIDPF